jgi:nucleoid-associated protein YgaU/DNA-binding SARP family transcriptional activator
MTMGVLRRIAGAITSLAGVAVLLLLIAGVPLMLVLLVGWPLPHTLPSWNQITMTFQTQGIDMGVLLRVLACVLWVLWAYLMVGMLVELVATLRGLQGRRRPWVAPGQRLAALLVGVVMLGIALMSRPAASTRPVSLSAALTPKTAVVALYDPPPHPDPAAVHASLLSSSPAPAADQNVQVQPGDSLWAIAGQEYGNPQEWPQIWGANQGQVEDNGQTFTDPSLIDPGWQLTVPDASPAATTVPPVETPAAAASPPALNAEQEVEVQSGDSLWAISGREYGNPQDWTQIWDADQRQTEENGQVFTDPSLIDPGWNLQVPALDPTATAPTAPAAPSVPTQAVPPASGVAPHDLGLPSLAPSLAPVAPSVVSGGAPASLPATGVPRTDAGSAVHGPTSTDAWVVTLAEAGVLAGITAAALGGLLLAAQRYERWRRRPGDPEGSRVALLARRPSLLRIRAALGTAGAVAHETAVPSVAVLSLQTRLEAIQSVPGRVVVGRRAGDDGDAIVDIDELHRVELIGPGAEGAARALMVSFLAHHGIENGQVVVATSPEGALIAASEGTPGLRLLEPAQLLDHLESEIRYQRGVLDRAGFTTWKQRVESADPLPALLAVLPAAAIESSHLERLTAAVEAARDLAVAVVIVGPLADAWWADVVEVDAAGTGGALSSLLLGRARTLHTLSRSEADELLAVIGAGRDPDLVPELAPAEQDCSANPWQGPSLIPELDEASALLGAGGAHEPLHAAAVAPPPPPAAPAPPLVISPALGPRRVDIRIYGQVRVLVDGQELVKALPDAGRQVLALLTVRGELTEDEIVDSLGAGSVDQIWRSRFVRGTRGTRPALREAFGDSTIDPMPFDGGVYRLDPDLVSSDFRRLLAGRDAALDTPVREHRVALLTRATEGIRGAPFTKADYLWLADDQEHVRSVAVDTLSQLAELHAAAGDLDKAIDTLDQALTLDPDPIEDLFRQQMLWQHRLGRPQAARDVYHQLVRQLSDRCDRIPSEETTALLDSLDAAPRVVVR